VEPETAEDVLAALKPLEGHAITTRVLDKLPGGRVEWRLTRELGTTELRNRAYVRGQKEGVCLTLAKHESNVLSTAFIEQENPEYFQRRRTRNALRAKALQNIELLERIVVIFNEIEELSWKCALAKKQLAVLVSPGEPFAPDRYDLERAVGLRSDEKER
jgi:hypothetical protein